MELNYNDCAQTHESNALQRNKETEESLNRGFKWPWKILAGPLRTPATEAQQNSLNLKGLILQEWPPFQPAKFQLCAVSKRIRVSSSCKIRSSNLPPLKSSSLHPGNLHITNGLRQTSHTQRPKMIWIWCHIWYIAKFG
jgi:hypothetical protein